MDVSDDQEQGGNHLDGHRHRERPCGKTIPASAIIVPLNSDEQTRLKTCAAAVRDGLRTFIEAGTLLMEIRDSRLHRGTHFTFGDYVNVVLSLTRPHAIQAHRQSAVVRDLSPIRAV